MGRVEIPRLGLALADNLAGGIQHTDIMAANTQIEAEGEPAGRDRGGHVGGNDGRSRLSLFFHRQSRVTQLLTPGLCLLILSC